MEGSKGRSADIFISSLMQRTNNGPGEKGGRESKGGTLFIFHGPFQLCAGISRATTGLLSLTEQQ